MNEAKALINSLDLRWGEKPQNPLDCANAYGLDIQNLDVENVVCADIVLEPIPFSDEFFVVISAFDFIEHIPWVIYAPNFIFSICEFDERNLQLSQAYVTVLVIYA